MAGKIGFALLLSLSAAHVYAAPASELHITPKGDFSAKNVVVMQKAGSNLFCRVTWDKAYVRLLVLTNPDGKVTRIEKNHGGSATVADIEEGDVLAIEGTLPLGTDALTVNAMRIVDYSKNREPKSFLGTISRVNTDDNSFVLKNKNTTVTVLLGTSTITKGVRTITVLDLRAGDKVLTTNGTYDFVANTVQATSTVIYQDPAVFHPKKWEGVLTAIDGSRTPPVFSVKIDSTIYSIFTSASTTLVSNTRTAISSNRMSVGDKVVVSGNIRQTDLTQIDATSIRDKEF